MLSAAQLESFDRDGFVVLEDAVDLDACRQLTGRSRHAYSVHLIDGTAEYPADNWLQRPADNPLRGF